MTMHKKLALLLSLLPITACDLGLDPDSLVRDLRVLAVRTGGDAAASTADVDLTGGALRLSALVAEPTGAGRKVAAPRALQHDWYLCVPGRSVLVTGSVDPECVKFGPTDPDPRQNPALLFLGSGSPTALDLSGLSGILLSRLGPLLAEAGAGSTSSTPLPALELQLPLVLRVAATPPTPDKRDAETAVTFVRAVFPLPGKEKEPLPEGAVNHNPTLLPVEVATDDLGTGAQALVPCQPPAPCQRLALSPGRKIFFKGAAAPGSLERYLPLDQSGRGVQTEVLRYSWFSSDGTFSELRTGDGKPWTEWKNEEPYQLPMATRVLSLWLVLQDGRNGTDTAYYELELQ